MSYRGPRTDPAKRSGRGEERGSVRMLALATAQLSVRRDDDVTLLCQRLSIKAERAKRRLS